VSFFGVDRTLGTQLAAVLIGPPRFSEVEGFERPAKAAFDLKPVALSAIEKSKARDSINFA
jgi:hypothetical protein